MLGLLLEEFPDVTISKIRFLESQGLIEPERTPSGYRKFFDDDVELLRVILREQRENFLPLRVIKDRIDSGRDRDAGPDAAARRRGRAADAGASVAEQPTRRRRSPSTAGGVGRRPAPATAADAADAARRRRRPGAPPASASRHGRRPACCRACSSTATSCARWRR